ncbi:MAG TPA: spore protease YyaC [Chondromyces sp.]|nr:spore protease YyaC [Chondromyces sp.]
MNLKSLFDRKPEPFKINYNETKATQAIGRQLVSLLPNQGSQCIVLICIGTDRSTGDSLGPLVGTLLSDAPPYDFYVYGTLDDPIHAVNLTEKLAWIRSHHDNPFIIGIDACLGKLTSVGMIQLGEGPVRPGAGVQKELPPVGDAHITGIVNVSGFMEYLVLQNTRLNLVMNMARTISAGILEASRLYSHRNTIYKKQSSDQQIEK